MSSTIHTLVVFNEEIRFIYTYRYDDREFVLDTQEIREILGEGISLKDPEVSGFIKEFLESNKEETDQKADV